MTKFGEILGGRVFRNGVLRVTHHFGPAKIFERVVDKNPFDQEQSIPHHSIDF